MSYKIKADIYNNTALTELCIVLTYIKFLHNKMEEF